MPDFLTALFMQAAHTQYTDPFIPEWEIKDFPE